MEHRVTIPLNSPSAHSLRMVEAAIASVWVFLILMANAQEIREALHRRLPASPAARWLIGEEAHHADCPKTDRHANAILSPSQALIVWLVLAIITADTVAILGVLGLMTVWEVAVALFTVLAVAAGAIWTLLLIPHKASSQAQESGSSEASPERMPLEE
jgi:hypothetical protein